MKRFTALVIPFMIGITLISCKRREKFDFDTTSSQDNNKMESAFDEVYNVVKTHVEEEIDNSTAKQGALKTTGGDNATVTLQGSDSIIVDFGNGTIGSDGRVRSGVVYIHYTGGYRQAGTVLTTTLSNYTVDGVKVQGKKVVTNEGTNSEGNIYFSVKVTNGRLTYPDGSVISNWSSTRERVWLDGDQTIFNPLDDDYEIYGVAEGINRKGEAFSVLIPKSDPLYIEIGCWLVSRMPQDGIIYIYPEGKEARSVDYGTGGGCDRKVTVSVGGLTLDLSL